MQTKTLSTCLDEVAARQYAYELLVEVAPAGTLTRSPCSVLARHAHDCFSQEELDAPATVTWTNPPEQNPQAPLFSQVAHIARAGHPPMRVKAYPSTTRRPLMAAAR